MQKPRIAVTDYFGPNKDAGENVQTAMRRDDKHRATPIIMMTSLPTALPEPDGLFDAVLRKPFTPDLLLETMASCLSDE